MCEQALKEAKTGSSMRGVALLGVLQKPIESCEPTLQKNTYA